MLFDAIEFATRAHAGQYRKASRLPYIYHPLAVARSLLELGCAEEVVVAALLHDTVEDTPVTLDEVRATFGERVAALVEGASEPDKADSWENRKQHTIAFLEQAPVEVLLIACADKLDNARSILQDSVLLGEAVWERFKRPRAHQAWYYHSLVALFARRATDGPLAILSQQLAEVVRALFGEPPAGNRLPDRADEG